MKFKLRPILSEIKEFYLKPVSSARFREYIAKLEGDKKGDLVLPISGYNPMAKEHILRKIEALESLDAECLMEDTIQAFNQEIDNNSEAKIEVVLNIADDLKGGWTNHYTTDFDSKFKLNALVARKFCAPYLWTSENYDKSLIQSRTRAYLSRTLYWLTNPKPKILEEHLKQEIFVFKNNNLEEDCSVMNMQFEIIEAYNQMNKYTEAYDLIFNFFMGIPLLQR